MKESQSLTNNLLMEVDVLSNRLRNIKQSYKTTENKALKGRLVTENKNIFKRVYEIHNSSCLSRAWRAIEKGVWKSTRLDNIKHNCFVDLGENDIIE